MRAHHLAFLVGFLGHSLAAERALGQPAPAPSAAPSAPAQAAPSQEDRERANALMDDADAKVTAGDLSGALAAYEQAHALMRVPSTGIEVAKTLEKLGKLLPALAQAREVAAMPAAASEPKPFTAAREQARALVTDLEARVPTLSITAKIAARGTKPEVTLDRRVLSASELAAPIALEPGRYRVGASADGHAPTSVEVVLKERDRGQVALVLAEVVEAPPPPRPPPPPPSATLSPWVPAGFTAAGVFAITGAITGALAISSAGDAGALCPAGVCPNETTRKTAQDRYNTADALAIVSDVSFLVAIAGAAAGIYGVTVSLSPPAPAKTTARPSIWIGPASAGLRLPF